MGCGHSFKREKQDFFAILVSETPIAKSLGEAERKSSLNFPPIYLICGLLFDPFARIAVMLLVWPAASARTRSS
jgi:hypothetical protein